MLEMKDVAAHLFVSRNTLRRMECGDPTVVLGGGSSPLSWFRNCTTVSPASLF